MKTSIAGLKQELAISTTIQGEYLSKMNQEMTDKKAVMKKFEGSCGRAQVTSWFFAARG